MRPNAAAVPSCRSGSCLAIGLPPRHGAGRIVGLCPLSASIAGSEDATRHRALLRDTATSESLECPFRDTGRHPESCPLRDGMGYPLRYSLSSLIYDSANGIGGTGLLGWNRTSGRRAFEVRYLSKRGLSRRHDGSVMPPDGGLMYQRGGRRHGEYGGRREARSFSYIPNSKEHEEGRQHFISQNPPSC